MRAAVIVVGLLLLVAGTVLFASGVGTAAASCPEEERERGPLGLWSESGPRNEDACMESPGFIASGAIVGIVGLVVTVIGAVIPAPREAPVVIVPEAAQTVPACPECGKPAREDGTCEACLEASTHTRS